MSNCGTCGTAMRCEVCQTAEQARTQREGDERRKARDDAKDATIARLSGVIEAATKIVSLLECQDSRAEDTDGNWELDDGSWAHCPGCVVCNFRAILAKATEPKENARHSPDEEGGRARVDHCLLSDTTLAEATPKEGEK